MRISVSPVNTVQYVNIGVNMTIIKKDGTEEVYDKFKLLASISKVADGLGEVLTTDELNGIETEVWLTI